MTSDTTRTTSQPDDAAARVPDDVGTLTARTKIFGLQGLITWRPPSGGFATGSPARLNAAQAGLERALNDDRQ
ncbi:hypothetical protein [Streptomyces sp. MNP-20]|uniref:hypothetical protein n=1 Tax=Streptomyces sp. MNP-20 TaxID=2721165 RepID=UPI0015542787|nr:hypothetical protein [Streptomyces sp. MNP-20]